MYNWQNVYNAASGGIIWKLYQLNPMSPAVELFHNVFWTSTLSVPTENPPHMLIWSAIALVTSIIILIIGELVFRKLDKRFAQEL